MKNITKFGSINKILSVLIFLIAIFWLGTFEPSYVQAQENLNPHAAEAGYPDEVTTPNPQSPGQNLTLVKTRQLTPGVEGVFTIQYEEKGILGGTIYHIQKDPLDNSFHVKEASSETGITEYETPYDKRIAATNVTTNPTTKPTAQTNAKKTPKDYTSLTNIPGLTQNGTNANMIDTLQFIFRWGIAVAVLLAILMTIIGGIQYMTTDAMFAKEEGKHKIQSAIMGLLLALSAWIILYTINPRILEKPESGLLR